MGTFWAIIIGAFFVIAVGALLFLGARYLRMQTHPQEGQRELPSSRDKEERDRRERALNPDQDTAGSRRTGGHTRVYRH